MKSAISARAGQNKVLTSFAQGYSNQKFVGCYLSPMVSVKERGGLFVVFDKTRFKLYDDRRSPGASYNVIESGYDGKPYKLHSKGLIYPIPEERMDEAKSIGLDLGPIATDALTEAEMLALEVEQATVLTNSANYASGNTEALSGTDRWDDPASNPSAQVEEWKAAISAQIAQEPNVMLLGYDVYSKLKNNAVIRDRLKYTTRDSLDADMLAGFWNLEKVVIGSAIADTGMGTTSRVWGKNVVLAYVNPAGLASGKIPFSSMMKADKAQPSFSYTYVYQDHPRISNPWFEEKDDTWRYKIKFDRDTGIVGVDNAGLGMAGFLARTVVS